MNLFQPVPAGVEEHLEVLAEGAVRIERIVSQGHASPPGFFYDQEGDEWVALLSGTARLRYEDGEVLSLEAGDHLLIPAHRRHRVEWTSTEPPCVWIAVHGALRDRGQGAP